MRKSPNLWVRGFEPRYSPFKIYNNSLDSLGLHKNKVLDFNSKWICGWSYHPRQQKIERYCKGFVTDEFLSKLKTLTLKEEFQSDKDCFVFKPLNTANVKIRDRDCLIISKKTKLTLDNINCNIIYWEDLTFNHNWWSIRNVNKQFELLFEVLSKMELSTDSILNIIPFCLEDEGISYYKSIKKLNFKTVTYLPNLFDFIDLKQASNKT